jgi:Spy/CpxP family protein refolding chaperone
MLCLRAAARIDDLARRRAVSSGAGARAIPHHERTIDMQTLRQFFTRPSNLFLLALPLAVACRGPGHHDANMTEAQITERMQDVAEFGLDSVDADDAQVERVNQLLAAFAPDVVRFRGEHRALAAELRAELSKEKIDRERVEALRQRALQLFDRASAKGGEALVAVADVLTPAQRNELVYKWEKHSK